MLTKEVMILIRPTRAEKAEQIKQAAFMFARVTRDASEIATALGVNKRTVERMMHLDSIPRRSWTNSAIRASGVFARHNEHSAMTNAHRSQSIRK